MDELDYLILSELFKNAQESFLEISKKLGVSSFTVKSRYERMKKENILFTSSIYVDLSKLGYQGKAILLITTSHNASKSVTIDAIKKIRNVISVSEILGSFDIMAVAPITDFNSIKALVTEVRRQADVQRVNVICLSDTMFPINPMFSKVLREQSISLALKLKKDNP